MDMRRLVLVLLLAAGGVLVRPAPVVQATDINENPECQRMFQRYAQPYFDQMQWFGSVAAQYPLAPNGRPIMTGWPYSGYGPGNGYGPGSPYGPNFGPWGLGVTGPGTAGPAAYGLGALGPGGPAWQFARNQAVSGVAGLNAAPPGMTYLSVASGV